MAVFHRLNYDRASGAPIELAALFAADAPYLERIATYCRQALVTKDALQFEEGVLPKAENFRHWNLTGEGLLITFDPYQVAPYVAGPQQVAIPLAELRDILAPDSPLKAGK